MDGKDDDRSIPLSLRCYFTASMATPTNVSNLVSIRCEKSTAKISKRSFATCHGEERDSSIVHNMVRNVGAHARGNSSRVILFKTEMLPEMAAMGGRERATPTVCWLGDRDCAMEEEASGIRLLDKLVICSTAPSWFY